MSEEKIYLRLTVVDGVKKVVDQTGREVHGVVAASTNFSSRSFDTATIEFIEHDATGGAIAAGGNG